MDQFCIRIGERGLNDLIPSTSYGAVGSIDMSTRSGKSESTLIDVLKASRSYGRSRVRQGDGYFKRDFEVQGSKLCDYLNYCCNESCVISTKELAPYCKG